MTKVKFPTKAKIIRGSWKKNHGYGDVWCKIMEVNMYYKEMCLKHPKYGEFAWVSISDCELQ